MRIDEFDCLKLENQLCFPLYAASKEVIRKYNPFLEKLNITYTQYITLMVLWENNNINVKELGKKLFLDSGTLTPLLKNLEKKGYLVRKRSSHDERNLVVSLTDNGIRLKEKAKDIPSKIGKCINLNPEESLELYKLLYKILNNK